MGLDSATFWGKGTEVPLLSRDVQGTGRAGTAKIRDGISRDSQNPGQDAGQNGTQQIRTF